MENKARIEVAGPLETPNKEKGDLLENLAGDLLRIQNYKVTQQVRVTATELDLLCEHNVSRTTVYVECKAHREPISANVLTNLLGTVELKGYHQGWLISTGPLGKEAKGFQHEWENKSESQRLGIYTPEKVIDALILAGMVKQPPYDMAVKEMGNQDRVGDAMLLITKYGIFWTIACLEDGVPVGVLVYSAETGDLVKEQPLLHNLAQTDTSQNELNFEYIARLPKSPLNLDLDSASSLNRVVEVEHGETWADYRPARPEHFVGRKDDQNEIIRFLKAVREGKSGTRVFAITGDSGMGKSSLIAKLRSRVQNQRYRGKFFIYAVDVRAATGASYIQWSLLACLRKAAERGFGTGNSSLLKISNYSNPLESPTIQEFLAQIEHKEQVICLVFDQFEELYSKPDVFTVFDAAQRLLISTVAAQSNLILGFAWKTDSTVQQDHPAYYMWHKLADHRMEVELARFTSSEASNSISIFQKELGQKLRPDLRRQLIENSQGYPWLLKKLSIHVYDLVSQGISQSELVDKALDIASLFDKDLQELTSAESTCLKMIAENAPADWYEMLNFSSQEVLGGLQNKRLIIRSGDRLNLYWDIFREYVLTQTVPSIALSYLPASPSIRAMLRVATHLDPIESKSLAELSKLCGLREKTIGNVIRDLNMFRIAAVDQSKIKLATSMEASNQLKILQRLRHVLQSHALTIGLSKRSVEEIITTFDIIQLLKQINPAARHQEKTWKAYAERMGHWLCVSGYLVEEDGYWKLEDQGEVNLEKINKTRKTHKIGESNAFMADTSPAKTLEALDYLRNNHSLSIEEIWQKGFRNAFSILRVLKLVKYESGKYRFDALVGHESKTSLEILWDTSKKQPTVDMVISFLSDHPTADGATVGMFVNTKLRRAWSVSSARRVGNGLRQWAIWILSGRNRAGIPEPLGRAKSQPNNQICIPTLDEIDSLQSNDDSRKVSCQGLERNINNQQC